MATGTIQKNMVLLWENSNKRTGFSAQTVAIDLSKYTAVLIEVVTNATGVDDLYQFGSMIVIKGTTGNVTVFLPYNGQLFNYFRNAAVSNNGVVFGAGYANGGQQDNAFGVPTRIFGIR